MVARVVVDNLPQVRAQLRAFGADAYKELGEVHKEVGRLWIGWLGGPDSGVGAGAGARFRPSANRREVLLRVGGTHRSRNVEQWGKRHKPERGRRPFILGAAEKREREIVWTYQRMIERLIRKHNVI